MHGLLLQLTAFCASGELEPGYVKDAGDHAAMLERARLQLAALTLLQQKAAKVSCLPSGMHSNTLEPAILRPLFTPVTAESCSAFFMCSVLMLLPC